MHIKPKKKGPSLSQILAALILVSALAYGAYRAALWYKDSQGNAVPPEQAEQVLGEAEAALKAGNPAEALSLASPLAENMAGNAWGPRAASVLAAALEAQQRLDEAVKVLGRAAQEFPTHPRQAGILMQYAGLLEAQGQGEAAARVYEQVRDSSPPPLQGAALAALGRQAQARGAWLEARRLYREALTTAAPGTLPFDEAIEGLGAVNVALIFSPKPAPESRVYTVQPGDNLIGIGVALNTTQGLLMRANNISDPAALRVGQKLKYTPKDFRIVIERSTCWLYLVDSAGIFKRYATGLGMPGHETTLGRYKIGNKQKHPAWFKPGEGEIPPGDPRNELGTRWMPLVPLDPSLPTDLGIHGTIEPMSIGKHSSHGCARMHNSSVEELYDLAVRSTPVAIVETVDPQSLLGGAATVSDGGNMAEDKNAKS